MNEYVRGNKAQGSYNPPPKLSLHLKISLVHGRDIPLSTGTKSLQRQGGAIQSVLWPKGRKVMPKLQIQFQAVFWNLCLRLPSSPQPFCSSISKIITPHTDLHAILRAPVHLRWGGFAPRPLTDCEWQIKSQGCRISRTFLLICSKGRKERMKDSENKGKGLTAEGG